MNGRTPAQALRDGIPNRRKTQDKTDRKTAAWPLSQMRQPSGDTELSTALMLTPVF